MCNDMIIVFFAELTTKGKNIMNFINQLTNNIKSSLSKFKELKYEIKKDHLYILLNGVDYESVVPLLKKVPGILSFALAKSCKKEIEDITKTSISTLIGKDFKSFKVETKRADKSFPMLSTEVSKVVGANVLNAIPNIKVDVKNPDIVINVYIRTESCYVYTFKEKGLGGYPLGIAGKALHLLSGGIDSPLAAFYMMKRGVKLEMIHFAAPPYTSEAVINKITDLLHILNDYQPEIKLSIVPFTKLEKVIYDVAGPSYCVTIMRRMMLRISQIIARRNKCIVLSTGESLGQVASQTLPSISVIEECINMPVIRPLATFDKLEIIKNANEIGTYPISIRPYEDCCTIFELKDPVTRPDLEMCRKIEENINYDEMIYECVKNIDVRNIKKEEDF